MGLIFIFSLMEQYSHHLIRNRKNGFLPNDFKNIRLTVDLVIRDCTVTAIPPTVANLTRLTHLSIYACSGLSTLPDELSRLPLTRLCITNCPDFLALPRSLARIDTLQSLEISDCERFTSLPDNIGDLYRLRFLTVSSRFGWERSRFTGVPEGICRLHVLQSLCFPFCISLQHLPRSILLLPNLCTLDLRGCRNFVCPMWMFFLRSDIELDCTEQYDLHHYRKKMLPRLSGCRLLTLIVAQRRHRRRNLPSELWEYIYIEFLANGLLLYDYKKPF